MSNKKPFCKVGVLNKQEPCDDAGIYTDEQIYDAMDEYAKQEAIGFRRWVIEISKYSIIYYTDEELYNLYLDDKKN